MAGTGSFGEVFQRLLNAEAWRAALSMADLGGMAGIPERTLARWRADNTRKPQQWQMIVRVAAALRGSEAEANELLTAAHYPTIATLRDTVTRTADRELLAYWAPPQPPKHLDLRLAYFTGRAQEADELERWLAQPEYATPLLVYGMPGVGKTALVNEVAHRMESAFSDGLDIVDLSGANTMTELNRLASAFGNQDLSHHGSLNSRSRAFREIIAGKRALLILDGAESYREVEPFLPHPPATTAVIITTRLRALDTTRTAHPLHIQPFEPDEAAELFTHILGPGAAQPPTAATLAQVAALAENLPMALAIAASQIEAWGIARVEEYLALLQQEGELLNHFSDESRNVRLVFETSYKSLPRKQLQPFFVALGAFAGQDFDAAAAAYVTGHSLLRTQESLIQLHKWSLLEEPQSGRYRLHALLRSYARSKQPGITHTQRMVAYYANYTAEKGIDLPALAQEFSNVEAALVIAEREGMAEAVFNIINPYSRFLINDGQFDVARTRLKAALPLATASEQPPAIYSVHEGLAMAAAYQGKFAQAEPHFQACLAEARAAGMGPETCNTLQNLSTIKIYQAQLPEAEALLQEALELARMIDYQARIGTLLSNLASVETRLGKWVEARSHLTEALAAARTSGNTTDQINILSNLSATEIELGEYAAAEQHLAEALAATEKLGNNEAIIRALRNSAELHKQQSHAQLADDYFQQALDRARQAGNQPLLISILADWGDYLVERQVDDRAEQLLRELIATATPTDFPDDVATARFGLARILAARGETTAARSLAQEALALCTNTNADLAQHIQTWLADLPDNQA